MHHGPIGRECMPRAGRSAAPKPTLARGSYHPVQLGGAKAVKCWVPADISAAAPPTTFWPSNWIELTYRLRSVLGVPSHLSFRNVTAISCGVKFSVMPESVIACD